jgi:hypothetical protein
MHQLDHHLTAAGEASADTEELAIELAEKKLDTFRIRWLIEDRGADVMRAISIARLNEQDLLKNPALKPLGLHRYLHTRH